MCVFPGHGFIMFLFAAYLVGNEKSLLNFKNGGEIWDTVFGGRYIILLMGCFSMYTGFIYNDVFAKSMFIVPSGWRLPKMDRGLNQTADFRMSHLRWDTCNQTYYTGTKPLRPCAQVVPAMWFQMCDCSWYVTALGVWFENAVSNVWFFIICHSLGRMGWERGFKCAIVHHMSQPWAYGLRTWFQMCDCSSYFTALGVRIKTTFSFMR